MTQTGTQIGTPMYMSPEQVKADKSIDHRSDIFSLGGTLYFALNGKPPYDANTSSLFDIFNKIVYEPLSFSLMNGELAPFIKKACEKDREQRFQSCEEWLEAIREFSNKTSVAASAEKTKVDSIAEKTIFDNPSEKTVIEKPKQAPVVIGVVALLIIARICFDYQNAGTSSPNVAVETTKPNIQWVSIRSGTFIMGSPPGEMYRSDNETQHQVSLSGFKMSAYEVTFEQYDAFCEATQRQKLSDKGGGRGKRPVTNVSWDNATAFAEWVGARLPTEAEWEYACRSGSTAPFATGLNLTTKQANYNGKFPCLQVDENIYRKQTTEVGSFDPNAFGLYDMHGNVWEWCSDYYDAYPSTAQSNPTGPTKGYFRARRGGGWFSNMHDCRAAVRDEGDPDSRHNDVGFRLVALELKR